VLLLWRAKEVCAQALCTQRRKEKARDKEAACSFLFGKGARRSGQKMRQLRVSHRDKTGGKRQERTRTRRREKEEADHSDDAAQQLSKNNNPFDV